MRCGISSFYDLKTVLWALAVLLVAETCAAAPSNPYVWRQNSPPPVPLNLHSRSDLGCTSLVWLKEMKPGYYTMHVTFATGKWRRDFVASIDHREIAFHSGYFTRDGTGEPPVYTFGFVVAEPGQHRIEIDCLTNTTPPSDRELKLLAIAIEQRPAPATPDPYAITDPGQHYCHGWGWMPGSSFQQRQDWRITKEYWEKRIIDESAKWGSNYIQLFPLANPKYLQDTDVTEAIRYAHEAGFLVDEHGISSGGLQQHLKQYFDRLERPALYGPDGWEEEEYGEASRLRLGSKENVIATDQTTWLCHPGCLVADCKAEPGQSRHYLHWLHEGFHGPNYGKFMMCAAGWALCGYDDMDVMSLFPGNLTFKNEYNWCFRGCQGNSRPYSTNIWGGSSWVDWIAKQAGDFFRPHAYALRDGAIPVNSVIAWLGESELTLPEQRREAVYAISMDPCRSALVYRLASTGRDGDLYWRRQKYTQGSEDTVSDTTAVARCNRVHRDSSVPRRPREWAPCTTIRLHNGILAADCAAFDGNSRLVWDSDNLGQFDRNAKTVELARSFLNTRLRTKAEPAAKHSFLSGSERSQVWNVKLPVGAYEVNLSCEKSEPFRAEVFLMGQYLGSLVAGPQGTSCGLPCYVSDDNAHSLELRLVQGDKAPRVEAAIIPTHLRVTGFARIGVADDSAKEFAAKVSCVKRPDVQPREQDKVPKRFEYSLSANSAKDFPARLTNEPQGPRVVDICFDANIGCYLLCMRARSTSGSELVAVSLNSHRSCQRNYRLPDPRHSPWYLKNAFGKDGNYRGPSEWGSDWIGRPGSKGCVGEFVATKEWQTFQIPIAVEHSGGLDRHKIELSIGEKGDDVEFDSVAIYEAPVEQNMTLVGGHKAILEESARLHDNGDELTERRRLWVIADEPTIWLESEKTAGNGSVEVTSTLDCTGYGKISFDGQEQAESGSSSQVPRRIRFIAVDALRPPMTVYILDKGGLKHLRWSQGRIDFTELVSGVERMLVAATLRDDRDQQAETYLRSKPETVTLGAKGRTFANNDSFAKVHLVEIADPIKGPYFAEEKGWWSVRGAQPLHKSEQAWDAYLTAYDAWAHDRQDAKSPMPMPPYGSDLVRLIIPAKSVSRLQPYGFIDGKVRPGWGSQKQMLIKDVGAGGCTVKVLSVSAYLFAPRVEFNAPFTEAKVNGQPWAYHDGRHVFLPQKSGTYVVEVVRGEGLGPTLQATAASIKSAVCRGKELTIQYELPEYVFKLPEGLHYNYYVSFDSQRTSIDSVVGGKLLRQGRYGAIIEALEETTTVRFK